MANSWAAASLKSKADALSLLVITPIAITLVLNPIQARLFLPFKGPREGVFRDPTYDLRNH